MHQATPGIHEQLGRLRQTALLDEARAAHSAALATRGRRERRLLRISLGLLPAFGRRSRQAAPSSTATPVARS